MTQQQIDADYERLHGDCTSLAHKVDQRIFELEPPDSDELTADHVAKAKRIRSYLEAVPEILNGD